MALMRLGEPEIEAVERVADAIDRVAFAITPSGGPAPCPSGKGHVASLMETMMGVTSGLVLIAEAINNLADSVREHNGGEE